MTYTLRFLVSWLPLSAFKKTAVVTAYVYFLLLPNWSAADATYMAMMWKFVVPNFFVFVVFSFISIYIEKILLYIFPFYCCTLTSILALLPTHIYTNSLESREGRKGQNIEDQ